MTYLQMFWKILNTLGTGIDNLAIFANVTCAWKVSICFLNNRTKIFYKQNALVVRVHLDNCNLRLCLFHLHRKFDDWSGWWIFHFIFPFFEFFVLCGMSFLEWSQQKSIWIHLNSKQKILIQKNINSNAKEQIKNPFKVKDPIKNPFKNFKEEPIKNPFWLPIKNPFFRY